MMSDGFEMKILITGANGFIGSQIVTELINTDHELILSVRDVETTKQRFPKTNVIPVDYNNDVAITHWLPRLHDVDIVINCVGLTDNEAGQSTEKLQYLAPKALFDACALSGVKRIIHLSAVASTIGSNSMIAKKQRQLDDYIQTLTVDWIICRPNWVYGSGATGSNGIIRGLAGLPSFIPLLNKGQQIIQPTHVQDVAACIHKLTEIPEKQQKVINLVSDETLSTKDVVIKTRHWLGFGKASFIHMPYWLVSLFALFFTVFSKPTLNMTAVRAFNESKPQASSDTISLLGHRIRTFSEHLQEAPSQITDRLHARLFFVGPLLRLSLAILWLLSGLIPLIYYGQKIPNSMYIDYSPFILYLTTIMPLEVNVAAFIFFACIFTNIVLGGLLLFNQRVNLVGALQCIVLVIYTIVVSIYIPEQWGHPFGPIIKNIPLLFATLTMIALSDRR